MTIVLISKIVMIFIMMVQINQGLIMKHDWYMACSGGMLGTPIYRCAKCCRIQSDWNKDSEDCISDYNHDNDNLRPALDEEAKRNLGFGLNGEYEDRGEDR